MKRARHPLPFLFLALALLPACGRDPTVPHPDAPTGATPPAPASTAGSTYTRDGVRIAGAEPGEWTHDWDAARALARRERLPLLALFTASDWNRWHKFLALRVLDTDEWRQWAVRRRIVLAWINLPNDATLVPSGALERNRRLARELDASAFPAALLVAPIAGSVINRYHVTDRTSASEFIAWLQSSWLDSRPGGPRPLLSEEDRAALEALRVEALPLEKEYARVLAAERAAHDALVARETTTDVLSAWARESDARLEAARAPLDVLRRRMDALYDKAMDAALASPAP